MNKNDVSQSYKMDRAGQGDRSLTHFDKTATKVTILNRVSYLSLWPGPAYLFIYRRADGKNGYYTEDEEGKVNYKA